jgi:hypothetical protein
MPSHTQATIAKSTRMRMQGARPRLRWPCVALAVAAVALLLPRGAWAEFTHGPSVRVSPNSNVEIR